jgi:hypothetical protein
MEPVTTNGSVSCKINKDTHKKLLVTKGDFWRIYLRTLRDEVQHEVIIEDDETGKTIKYQTKEKD